MLGALLLCGVVEVDAKTPVHLIHILADDLGYNGKQHTCFCYRQNLREPFFFLDVSWHNPRIKTPALQKLRDDGIWLNNFHTWKACAPSRGAIMSGT